MLYPLKFEAEYFDKIWGGSKHYRILKRDNLPLNKINSIGESWDISCFDACKTKIANGPLRGHTISDLLSEFGPEKVLGTNYKDYKSSDFPLLVKVIDASDDLSVQVHPDSEYCKTSPKCHSKKESWIILQKDEGATLIHNFNEGMVLGDFFNDLDNNNDPAKYLRKVSPNVGDIIHVDPGIVHAIGRGILLLEIQETSDTTFRVYDYGRPRELHVEQAKNSIKVLPNSAVKSSYKITGDMNTRIECFVKEPEYTLVKFTARKDCDHVFTNETFKIISNVGEKVQVIANDEAVNLKFGESILLPGEIEKVSFKFAKEASLIFSFGGNISI